MTQPPRPVWADPLLQPAPPVGTGTGAYVEQPEPRANPMTIEGEIAAFGEIARGAAKRGGAIGWLARAWVLAMIAGFVASGFFTAWVAFGGR